MRIASIKLKNFLCYRGEHELKLEPKVYAVIARLDGDAERSNWLGKTTLLEAIDFALYGRHRHRVEDDWITRGEAAGEVELHLEDNAGKGVVIKRSRLRGKRTTLYFGANAIQEEAQKQLDELVGLGSEDFLATCYFEQRQMARLVLADPGERMNIVSGWLHLGPLQECEDTARVRASKLAEQVQMAEGALAVLEARRVDALQGLPDVVALAAKELNLSQDVEVKVAAVAKLQDKLQKNAALLAGREKITEFDVLVVEGIRLRDELEQRDIMALRRAHDKADEVSRKIVADYSLAERELSQKRALARGQFDGQCPVAGIECPAKEKINSERQRNALLLEGAQASHGLVSRSLEMSNRTRQMASAELQEAERIESKLEQMRRRAAEMMPAYEQAKVSEAPEDLQVIRGRLDAAQMKLQEAQGALGAVRGAVTGYGAAVARIEEIRTTLDEARAQLAVLREAGVIFGKTGAQRRVAEGALEEIEGGANDMLRSCGIDLRAEVRWSREGSGLAKACEACGNPFPTSAKVKTCPRCGAGRGPLLVNKLEVSLSDRSGAAEDLGGAAIQLAASAWLRRERGSAWGTALLDEPFGSLDATHRKVFAAHLTAMLKGSYGFEQALVIAHHSSVLDALPGRIEITSDGKHSSIRVVA